MVTIKKIVCANGVVTHEVYLKKNDTKPIEGINNASTLMFIDSQSDGVMLFDEDEKCWWDKGGNKWTQ